MIEQEAVRPTDDLYAIRARALAGRDDLGLRDRHKIDKLTRISDAAHKLFARDGYEAASLRAIAREAGVALGTLSLYARDKRDLILLIFNKVIPPLLDRARRNADAERPLAQNIVAFFAPFYQEFASEVTLYRIVLGQIYAGPDSVHAHENQAVRAVLLDMIATIVSRAAARGEIAADIEPKLAARSFYLLHFAAIRAWLSTAQPEPEQGVAELQVLFDWHVRGLLPREEGRPGALPLDPVKGHAL